MKKISLVIILMIISFNLNAASLFDRDVGEEMRCFSARSLAMGSVEIASSEEITAALNNPAILGLLHNKFGFQLTANVTKNDENREYPLYDSFDSYLDDAVYVSNAHFFDKYSGGIYFSEQLSNSEKLTLAFNFAPLYNFDFKYEEEMRNNENTDNDNEQKKIANNSFIGSGKIYAYSPSIALSLKNSNSPISSLSLGFGVSFLEGESEMDSTIIFTDWAKEQMLNNPDSLRDTTYTMKNKYSGIRYQGGLIVGLNEHINLGFSYTHKSEITKKFRTLQDTVWNDTTIYYPSKFGVGFEYHPRNEWDTKFSIDAELIRWSEYDSLYDDVLEFSAGIEHIMHNGIPIRLGFRYQPSGQNKEITLIAFSTGTSIKLPHNFVLDIGTEIGKRNYSEMDLFPDGYYAHESLWDTTHNDLPEDRDEPDKVSDFMINAIATISWKF